LRYGERTFGIFSQKNIARKFCIEVGEMREFDWFIMLVIAANTIVMCMAEPQRMDGRGCAQHAEGPYLSATWWYSFCCSSQFSES